MGANYHKGQVLVYKLETDGRLVLCRSRHPTKEVVPMPIRKQVPHTHHADLTPDQYLITCDLGTDRSLHVYDVSEEGETNPDPVVPNSSRGRTSSHWFHPHYKTAYLINELNATIDMLFYDGMGEFEHFQTVSTLPSDHGGQKGLLRSSFLS